MNLEVKLLRRERLWTLFQTLGISLRVIVKYGGTDNQQLLHISIFFHRCIYFGVDDYKEAKKIKAVIIKARVRDRVGPGAELLLLLSASVFLR